MHERNIKDEGEHTTKPSQLFDVVFFFFVDFMNAVERQRHWINTETAITSLKRRDRPLKSKYLKDAYELRTRTAAEDKSETVMASNGCTDRIGNGGGTFNRDSGEGGATKTETCLACLDGGCLRNSV